MTRNHRDDLLRSTEEDMTKPPKPLQVGDLEIYPVYDGYTAILEPAGISERSEDELRPHRTYIPGDGRYLTQFGAFLIRIGERLILMDAGMGPRDDSRRYVPDVENKELVDEYTRAFLAYGRTPESIQARLEAMTALPVEYGHLQDSLTALGVSPDDVTDVVVTHLHCDHMGWVSNHDSAHFRNAAIWVHEADAKHFLSENAPSEAAMKLMYGVESTRERMRPVMGQLETWSQDRSIAPGVDLVHYPGHTPGSSVVVLTSRGEDAVMVGDVIHCPLEMTDDTFSIKADIDPDQAFESKRRLMRTFKPNATYVGSTHFPDLAFGQLGPEVNDGFRSWRWV